MEPQLVRLENELFYTAEFNGENYEYYGDFILPKFLRPLLEPRVISLSNNVLTAVDREGQHNPQPIVYQELLDQVLSNAEVTCISLKATHFSLDNLIFSTNQNYIFANVQVFGIFIPYRLDMGIEQLELKI
ncbi:hypothetical protein J4476_00845 [Candidatus Woesearchaeota archaeon]|nr:MAG: hypothetical protein QT09_C0001G0048 [archaeon GW2011_AR18]MBS3161229.1 hypothetical protein [Candidatus Woesearchaeota archaeon]HIH25215.1 hypothetical protein [Nanoarchaeota archaeon]